MKCKYWDCGWCYAPIDVKTNANQGECISPENCPYLKTQMTEPYYVIKYDDDNYNFEDGHPCCLYEATRYATYEEAEKHTEELVGVKCIEKIIEEPYSDTEILEFLLNQFQMHSPQMNGVHSWRMGCGYPMNHVKGRTARDAVINAMRLQKKNEP
jgi:hypothetical protein